MVRRVHIITNCSRRKRVSIKEIEDILREHGLPIPTDNLELEDVYKEVLKDFVLPAYKMYVGITSPLLKLVERGYIVYVISGRYGLIDAREPIVPYDISIDKSKSLEIAKKKLRDVYVDGYVVLTRKYCESLGEYVKGRGKAVVPKGCELKGFENYEYSSIFELKRRIKEIVEELSG